MQTVVVNKNLPILESKDIWFSFGQGKDILKGISIQIFPGVVTMVLGRSGTGKTTLLKALAGIISPQKGTVSKGFLDDSPRNLPHIAYIPQSLGLVKSMTTLENVLMGSLKDVPVFSSLFKVFSPAVVAQAKNGLLQLGLEDKCNERVSKLSGGQRQRVAIARALMQNPQVILADEFVSHLDAVTTHEILGMMQVLTKKGIAFLITTHDVDLVKRYADWVVIMGQGVMMVDSPAHCLTSKQIMKYLE